MTNAERIRQMTDEELAKWLNEIAQRCRGSITRCIGCPIFASCGESSFWHEKWLKQEATDVE